MPSAPDKSVLFDEFISPLLETLGWEQDSSKTIATSREKIARDVVFRTGGQVRSIDCVITAPKGGGFAILVGDPTDRLAATGLRRYAWNAGLDLAIVTNFSVSAAYHARVPVHPADSVEEARIALLTIDTYTARWDQIAGVLSSERVLEGSINAFLEEQGGIGRESMVAQALHADLESWRLLLAKRIVLTHPGSPSPVINQAVHLLLLRILFLRIAEDRGLGEYGLLSRVMDGGSAYGRLCGLFKYADEVFGAGLFSQEDRGAPGVSAGDPVSGLEIDDNAIKTIISRLSSPESPYEFSVISARTLAGAFQPFLGSIIRLPSGQRAVVEPMQEMQKGGRSSGIPGELAGYIVNTTLFGLLAGRTPSEAEGICILDPSCGSGLFLVMAYEYLLDWHLAWYTNHPGVYREGGEQVPALPAEGSKETPGTEASEPTRVSCGNRGEIPDRGGIPKLGPEERKRILLAMIFGVDIDMRATLTTRVLLIVTLINGMGREILPLPDLSPSIRCGNALVGTDLFDGPEASQVDPLQKDRLRVIDWDTAFPQSMAAGGFGAVIGQPPLFRGRAFRGEKEYLERHYSTCPGTEDLYPCFVERALSLARPGGIFSALLPSGWLRSDKGSALRRFLAGYHILEIIGNGDQEGGIGQHCIIRVAKERPGPFLSVVEHGDPGHRAFETHAEQHRYCIPSSRLLKGPWLLADTGPQDLLGKIQGAGTPLGELVMGSISPGIRLGPAAPFVINAETRAQLIDADPGSAGFIMPVLSCEGVHRYSLPIPESFLIVVPHGTDLHQYPALAGYLHSHRKGLVRKRRNHVGKETAGRISWYEIPGIRKSQERFSEPGIGCPTAGKMPRFSLALPGSLWSDSCLVIGSSSLYLLGILNSSLVRFYLKETLHLSGQDIRNFTRSAIASIPIYIADFDELEDAGRHDSLELLVGKMLDAQGHYAKAGDPAERSFYSQQITELDRAIDDVVCDLYRLTEEEVRIARNR